MFLLAKALRHSQRAGEPQWSGWPGRQAGLAGPELDDSVTCPTRPARPTGPTLGRSDQIAGHFRVQARQLTPPA